jgi:hypothetical protein
MPIRMKSIAAGRRHFVALLTALLLLLNLTGPAPAELAFRHDFNGPQAVWQILDTGNPATIVTQQCIAEGARDRDGAERVVAAAADGQSMHLQMPCARVAVLPELIVRLWVKSDRPSIQLAVQISLPRTLQPKTGAPVCAIVRGKVYGRPGHWQQLVVSDIPKQLAAEIRVMRSAPGAAIDPKEAVVQGVVLIVPGDPNGVEVMTDSLEIDGVLLPNRGEIKLTDYSAPIPMSSTPVSAPAGNARLQGGILLVDDRPFVARVIEWRGEALAFLAERGFNTVLLPDIPTQDQVTEAGRLGLWFVATGPRPISLADQPIGQPGDRILAWLLQDEAIEIDPNYAQRWASLIRQNDSVPGRPVVIVPKTNWEMCGRSAEVLAAHFPVMRGFDADEYAHWLESRSRYARPGTPIWACYATQVGETAHRQAMTLAAGATRPAGSVDMRQIHSQLDVAGTRGVRGFVFYSRSSLSEPDALSRRRAVELELINRRLQLLEPWLAGGSVTGRITSSDSKWDGVVLQVERARLVIPIERPAAASAAPTEMSTATAAAVSFIVPGVPESSHAYSFTPVSLRSLSAQRVAGGTRITVPSIDGAFMLITEDPQVIRDLRGRIARDGPKFVRLQRNALAHRAAFLTYAAQVNSHATGASGASPASTTINPLLQQIDGLLAAGGLEAAFAAANSAEQVLDDVAIAQRRAVGSAAEFDSDPLAVSSEYLAEQATFQRTYATFRDGENLLYAGDFEDLGQMTHFGWRHFQHPIPGVESRVELSAGDAKQGSYCLALHATGAQSGAPAATDDASVWVVSPPMPVQKDQFIEITGWVRISGSSASDGAESRTGLQIVDSLGGAELSLTIRGTDGWQPFRMLRAAPESGELRVTFALVGSASAQVDAVMARTLARPVARRLPPAAVAQPR